MIQLKDLAVAVMIVFSCSDREERHQAQARLIYAVLGPEEASGGWAVPERTGIDLINGSHEPVYRLVVAIVGIQGPGVHTIERWHVYRNREAPPQELGETNPRGTSVARTDTNETDDQELDH